MRKFNTITLADRQRAVALSNQNLIAQTETHHQSARPLAGPLPGSPHDQSALDLSQCPLAKAYPHWDHYVEEKTSE